MIPKIIHFCWLSNDPIPEDLEKYMASWKKKLPDYKFVKWDFNRFDKEKSIWVSEAYDNKKYAFAADYIRLYAIYNMGGIYLDMDIEVLKSFNDLLNNEYMFAYESELFPYIEAGCFGAEKKSPFIKYVLDYYENRHFIKEDGTFDMIPLPQVMKKVLDERDNIKINFMDWHTFTNKSFETGIEAPIARSYAIHHFAGSWKTETEKKEIELHQRLTRKYGKLGDVIFKFIKYVLHPSKLLQKAKERRMKYVKRSCCKRWKKL